MAALEILHQDSNVVAINKPAGLLVHRTNLDRRLYHAAMQKLRDQIGQPVFVVHRLDRATSGVLLFALSQEAARFLTNEFQERRVKKTYIALVRGYCDDTGTIDTPLYEKLDRISDAKADVNKAPQEAVTHFQTLSTVELPYAVGRYDTVRYSLVRITPDTGRRHQIRRHFKYISHPIVGDTTHGDHRHNKFITKQFGIDQLMLLSHRLQIAGPDGELLSISAQPSTEMKTLLDAVGIHQLLVSNDV